MYGIYITPAVIWDFLTNNSSCKLMMNCFFYGSTKLRVASWTAGAIMWMLPHAWYHQIYKYGRMTFGMVAEEVGSVSGFMRAASYVFMLTYISIYSGNGVRHLLAWGRWGTSAAPWAALVLIKIGQTLNVAVYKAIGAEGVYYGREIGTKSGKDLQLVSCFPFNCRFLPHPMYLGAIFTSVGLGLLWGYGKVSADVYMYVGISIISYMFSIRSESGKSYKNN